MPSFLSKINVKLIVIDFVAFWLFIYAFHTLAYLYDFNFFILSPDEARINDVPRTNFDIKLIALATLLGAIVGYIISWRISLKRGWHWINATVAFAIIYVLQLYNMLGWQVLQNFAWYPGSIFRFHTRTFYVTNGLVMLGLGCLLLFSKRIQRFISGRKAAQNQADTTGSIKAAKTR